MSVAGSISAPIEIIGGLVCDTAASELPPGVSPDCQDVIFSESSVRTRPGLTAKFAALAGNPTVNWMKTFVKLDGTLRLLVFDGLGNLFKESAPGVLSSVQAAVGPQSLWASSATIFGREYLAFGDGKVGQDIPRQFDDTNLDRVTQGGPGAPPTVADENLSVAIAAGPNGATQPAAVSIAAAPNGATAVGFLVTIQTTAAHGLSAGQVTTIAGVTLAGYNGTFAVQTVPDATHFTYVAPTSGLAASGAGTSSSATATILTSAAHGLVAGQLVVIANVGVAGYNGTFTVATVPDATHFTYSAGAGGLGASGAGTAGSTGSIIGGVHGVAVAFQLRSGAITAPSPVGSWNAAGGRRAVVSNLPTGPPNVTGRILLFTAAGGATYYYIPPQATTLFSGSTVVNDNSSTTVSVDFTDAILLGATPAQSLFSQIELSECQGVIDYSQRLFWWGERNKMNNWVNLGFDGGFTGPTLPNYPLGWTPDGVYAPGGASALAQGGPVVWGDAYAIVGSGVTAIRGLMTQSAVQDALNVPRIQAGTGYSIRARVARNAALLQGTLHIHLYSASGGINTTGITVAANDAGIATANTYKEYTAVLTAALATIPSDLVVRIYADGTPSQFGGFFVDSIEIFPTNTAVNPSLVRASLAESQEDYDGVTGFLNVAENNGQAIRAAFKLRERLYFVKEHSLHVTQDNGATEPNQWTVSEVSRRVGTPSVRGVGMGEDWAVIADRGGLYIFSGGEPKKISQEIGHSNSSLTLAWDQINWLYGHTLWVAVDTQERRIYVGAPFGAATSPNAILQLDYRDIAPGSADDIAGAPPVTISYRGIKIVRDKSRKWSPWTIAANHGAVVERQDGTQQFFLGAGAYGNQVNTGKIWQLDPAKLSDDGAAIPSYYLTSFVPQRETEQMLQLPAHRKIFTYLAMYCEGAGQLTLTAYPLNEAFPQTLPVLTLQSPANKDLETTINVLGERVAFKLGTNAVGSWFRLQKLMPNMAPEPWAPVRGQN